MHNKLKVVLKRRSSEQGFAIPIVMGLGLVMILIGATMVVSSQGDKVTASAQKGTAQSLSLSEAGVTLTQALLQRFPGLAAKRYDSTTSPVTDEWTPYTAPGAKCSKVTNPVSSILGLPVTNGWIYLPKFGHFKIVRYTPNTPSAGVGTLEVLGTTDKDTSTLQSNNRPQGAISSLSVQIPYATPLDPTIKPAGLWAATLGAANGNKSIGQTNQKISGNVLTQDCDASNLNLTNNFPSGTHWTVYPQPYVQFPSLPALPPHVAARSTVTTLGTGDITLPLPDNVIPPDPGTTDTYSYLVPSINVNSLTITAGKKVRLYVQGNITLGGNSDCGSSTETNALQIYGSNATGTNGSAVNYRLNSDTTGSYTTTAIRLGGKATIYAFIFAPAAIAGDNGGGSGGGFYGSIWVSNWAGAPFGSDSNHIEVTLPSNFNWSLLPSSLLYGGGLPGQTIQPLVGWQRKEAP